MDSDVQRIKDKLNIVDIVGQYVTLRRAGRTYTARCPFHKERTASFHVSPERGTYKCFGCGEGGDIFSFVQKMDGVDFPTALRQLADKAGVKLERQFIQKPEQKERTERLLEALESAAAFFESMLLQRKDVRDYLRSRGVHDDTVKSWRLGFAPASWEDLARFLASKGFTKEEVVDAGLAAKSERNPQVGGGERIYDRFRGRIMFPIFDLSGRVIAFSGRFFENIRNEARKAPVEPQAEPAKYVNSPETALFKKSRVLYGFDRAKSAIRKADCILLVEGQFDLILSHQSGLPITVALSGTALTSEHLTLLGRISKRLVLALDADAAGLRSGLKSAALALAAGFDVKVPTFAEGKDPADLARENPELLKAAIRTSQTAVEFFLEALRPGTRDERAYKKQVEVQVLPLIAAMESKIDQAHFVHLVAQKLAVPESAVMIELAKRPLGTQFAAQEEGQEVSAPEIRWNMLEKSTGMLLFAFEKDAAVQERLEQLLGNERRTMLLEKLLPQAEMLRFTFESEVVGDTTEATVAGDLFKRIELLLLDEQMSRAGSDLKTVMELARRKEELRK
jgi:DNA primase